MSMLFCHILMIFLSSPEILDDLFKRKSEEWQWVEEEITCSICRDLFSDPMTLPCLHTFCIQCFKRIIEYRHRCPLCCTPIPQKDVFLFDFTIRHLVEAFKKQRWKADKSLALQCSNCENNLPAATWCIECENCLCEYCNDAHKRITHTIISVEELIINPKLILATPKKPGKISAEWQQVETEITCKVCYELFTDPKTILCLHTFCKQCIEKLVCCPLCRKEFQPDTSFQTNFTISNLVKNFRKKKEAYNAYEIIV